MTKLQELELAKDKAALDECTALIEVHKLEDQLRKAEFVHRCAHYSFLEIMREFFTEKIRVAEKEETA